MKSFILKILRFLSILFSIILIILMANRYFSNFTIQGDDKILVVGHSHSSCSINDTLISELVNRSNPGEAYLYNYFKTRELLKQNPDIQYLFIELSNDQLDYESMSEWLWGDEFLLYNFPKYGSFMDGDAYRLLNTKNPRMFVKSFSLLMRKDVEMFFKKLDYNRNNIGGFTSLQGSNVARKIDSIERRERIFKENSLAVDNIRFLEKTIIHSRNRGVKVYLIRSPLHSRFMEYENLDNEDSLRLLVENLKNKYPGLEFLDFINFPLSDEEFKDLGHLNSVGASHFSKWLSALIDNGLLEKEDPAAFVELEIKKLQE